MKINSIINGFKGLSYFQQRELLEQFKLALSESKPILEHKKLDKQCIYCSSIKVYKHGIYKNGGSRFRCQDCKKSYNELTGTSIHCIKKKELWDRFIELMLDSKSIRYISKELKLNVKTVFDWRHKVLASFENIYKKKFENIVEIDDVYFSFNQKGRKNNFIKTEKIKRQGPRENAVSVLFTMDRNKTYDVKLVKFGKLDIASLNKVVDKSRFSKNIVCSDSNWSLVNMFEEMNLVHKTFKTGLKQYSVDGIYHVNNLNNFIGRTRQWISYNFHSVSTKYLSHYLNWFVMLQILKDKGEKNNKFWDYLLLDNRAFERNKNKETNYSEFLKLSGIKN